MSKSKQIQQYRDAQTMKLIDAHKDIISKTWEILDQNVLDEEIKNAKNKKNTTESLFWDKLGKRRKGLDEVERSLNIIETLQKKLSDYSEGEGKSGGEQKQEETRVREHPSKKHARR